MAPQPPQLQTKTLSVNRPRPQFMAQQQAKQQAAQIAAANAANAAPALPGHVAPPVQHQPVAHAPVQAQQFKAPLPPAQQPLQAPPTPGPSMDVAPSPAPALTLEQQHITAVEGIVPTLQFVFSSFANSCFGAFVDSISTFQKHRCHSQSRLSPRP